MLLSRCRVAAAFVAVACAMGAAVDSRAADSVDALPPEPITGEWIEDTLADDSLWFAASGNLAFEALAAELTDYPRGRRWVRVVDGRPAWVMYYVPGEILGFEIDTHHFGARAVDFRFAAGSQWNALTPVEADYEEIAAFEAKWLRLYRAADRLPGGACFLRIEFPNDAEIDAARLTEVWLRCRFDETIAPRAGASATGADASARTAPVQIPPAEAVVSEPEIEPLVVTTFVYSPPMPSAPAAPAVMVDPVMPAVQVRVPLRVTSYELLDPTAPLLDAPGVSELPGRPSVLSRLVSFLHRRR